MTKDHEQIGLFYGPLIHGIFTFLDFAIAIVIGLSIFIDHIDVKTVDGQPYVFKESCDEWDVILVSMYQQ